MIKIFIFFYKIFKHCVYFITRFFVSILHTRSVVIVHRNNIVTYRLGPFFQIFFLSFSIYFLYLLYYFSFHKGVISKKNYQINVLSNINNSFRVKISDLDRNFQKINLSLSRIYNYGFNFSYKETGKANLDLKESNSIIKKKIDLAKNTSKDLEALIDDRISNLEENIKFIGINSIEEFLKYKNVQDNIHDKMLYLEKIENFSNSLPISKPMEYVYISSSFGKRIDPIHGYLTDHYGVDFVGEKNAKIITPVSGEVKFAGKFGSFGNTIAIDHGYEIVTRYAHLSNIMVKKGDYVKRGDVIGIQGNTGRSTGSHLHYEVRYKGKAINPEKLLNRSIAFLFSLRREYTKPISG